MSKAAKYYLILFAFCLIFKSYSQNVNYQVYDRQYYTGIGNTDFWTDDDPSWGLLVFDNTDGYTSGNGVIWMIDNGLDGAAWFNPADGLLRSKTNTAATGIKVRLESWEDDACGSRTQYNTGCSNDDDNHCGPSLSGVISFRNDPVCQWNNYQYDCSSNWKAQYKIYWDWAVAPTITTQPTAGGADRVICSPTTTTLSVVADAAARFYQWQINTNTGLNPSTGWTDIGGATGTAYTPPSTPGTRNYRVKITSNCTADYSSKTTYSNSVRVTQFPFAPSIISTTCGTSIVPGIFTFSIPEPPTAGGVANSVSYTWSVSPAGPTISSPNSSTTTISFPSPSITGYTITMTVADGCGAADATSTCVITSVAAPHCDYIYVSPTGSSGNTGGPFDPYDIVSGFNNAAGSPIRKIVRVLNGTYTITQALSMGNNVIVEGDYEIVGTEWRRNSSLTTTVNFNIADGSPTYTSGGSGHWIGLSSNAVSNWQVEDITFNLKNGGAAGTLSGTYGSFGKTLYGLHVQGGSTGFELLRTILNVGAATNGGTGAAGAAGTLKNNGASSNNGDDDDAAAAKGTGGNGGAAVSSGIRLGGAGGKGGNGDAPCSCATGTGTNGSNGGGGALGATGGGGAACGDDDCGCCWTGGIGGNGNGGATGSPNWAAGNRPATPAGGIYWVPTQSDIGGDGGGGGGGKGGGGGAGQCNSDTGWFSSTCDVGTGAGGGGGGSGGQGGGRGSGGYGGGSSFGVYTYGTGGASSGTLKGSTVSQGAAGTGGNGGAGGGGTTGGAGGSGARCCGHTEISSGGNGGAGGTGGTGGRGRDAHNALSETIRAQNGASISTVAHSPSGTFTIVAYRGCTNSEIIIYKDAGNAFDFASMGNCALVPNITSSSTNYSNAVGSLTTYVYWSSTGDYTLKRTADTDGWDEYAKIRTSRSLPTIDGVPASLCSDGTVNLQCSPNIVYGSSEFEWTIQETPVTGPSSPAPIYTSSLEDPGDVTLPNATGSSISYQIRLRVKDQCCGWSIPVYQTVSVSPEILTYAVTGGGIGCSVPGVVVGLDNSQIGINYQLLLNGVNQGSAIVGTGAAISFGPQTSSGTYTIEANCPAGGATAISMTGSASITIMSSNYWIGAVSSDWFNSNNWCLGGGIPTSATDIYIPDQNITSFDPDISAVGAVCKSITIESNALFTISGTNELDIYGDWTNNGSFVSNSSTVLFKGSSNNIVNGNVIFYNMGIDKGANYTDYTLDIGASAYATNELIFTNGLIRVGAGASLNAGSVSPTISNSAGLHINGGSLTTGAIDINNNGLFRVSSGTVTVGASINNSLIAGSTGVVTIEGGTVNIASRLEINDGNLTVSSGILNLGLGGTNHASKSILYLSGNSDLNISGGLITLQDANTDAGGDLTILNTGGTKTITGGTMQIGTSFTSVSQVFLINNSVVDFYNFTVSSINSPKAKLITNLATASGGILAIDGGILDLNQLIFTVKNGASGGISRTSPGYILSEDVNCNAKVVWNINDATTHIFPFGNSLGTYIPVYYTKTGGTNANISATTYNVPDNVYPVSSAWYPPTVTNLQGWNPGPSDVSDEIVRRFWYINALGGGTPTATVRFYWDDGAGATQDLPISMPVDASFQMQRWNGAGWDPPLASQTIDVGNKYLEVPSISSFSPWVAKGNSFFNPLPIELMHFSAICNEKLTYINWVTGSETNNDYFLIERSSNNKEFTIVGKINGAGNSSSTLTYAFIDTVPYPGNYFYRIKQVDFDGSFKYSMFKEAKCELSGVDSYEIFPNPASEIINILIKCQYTGRSGNISIIDVLGKTVFFENIMVTDRIANLFLNIKHLSAGTYSVKIDIEGCSYEIKKLIIL